MWVIAGLDPANHDDALLYKTLACWNSSWMRGSRCAKTALRAFCPRMTVERISQRSAALVDLVGAGYAVSCLLPPALEGFLPAHIG
jgi:hypothetical protein